MPTKNRKDIYRRRGMITVALGEDKIRLVELAKRRGVSVSDLAARAIYRYLDQSDADSKRDVELVFRKAV